MANKKIVLISSGQPSLNPRLVKEADALSGAGYEVTVLYAYWNDWGTEFDKQLLAAKNWKAIRVGGTPQHKKLTYFFSRLINGVSRVIIQKTNSRKHFAEYAIARSTYFLIKEAKKHKADLYIAHNPGALPAAAKAAKMYKKPFGFDAEDFHRFETGNDDKSYDALLKSYIENKYIPQASYLTASSPQIADAYHELFPATKPVVIYNVFTKSALPYKTPNDDKSGPIKLFWFSQTIGANRGITDVIKALQILDKQHFELHLLGNQPADSKSFINEIINSDVNIKLYNPIPPDDLTAFAAQFDIGLALEQGFSINNNIALSNKLFTYMQAGLALIATDTAAQQDFINKNNRIGSVYAKGDAKALAAILSDYYQHRDQLSVCKNAAFSLAQDQYNWETESIKFLNIISTVLSAHDY